MAGKTKTIFRCTECGATFPTPQGLGAHRYQKHGVRSPQSATGPGPSPTPLTPERVAATATTMEDSTRRGDKLVLGQIESVESRFSKAENQDEIIANGMFPVMMHTVLFTADNAATALSNIATQVAKDRDSQAAVTASIIEFESEGLRYELKISEA